MTTVAFEDEHLAPEHLIGEEFVAEEQLAPRASLYALPQMTSSVQRLSLRNRSA